MARVKWSSQARSDLDSIVDHIAHDSPARARMFHLNALNATQLLESHPQMGHPVPEADDTDVREIQFGRYRIIYWVFKDDIVVLTIHHGRRRLPKRKLIKRTG